jgi:hypothetical protein
MLPSAARFELTVEPLDLADEVNLVGVFSGLPLEHAIHGSLWTLPIRGAQLSPGL